MRLYLSGRILSAPSLHIHCRGLGSAPTRRSTLSTGTVPGGSWPTTRRGGTETDWATLRLRVASAPDSRAISTPSPTQAACQRLEPAAFPIAQAGLGAKGCAERAPDRGLRVPGGP